jgi:hypothetical protein
MFQWYKRSELCYAYLVDVDDHQTGPFIGSEGQKDISGSLSLAREQFRASRWFTRGWTLQELVAPSRVEFFSSQWTELGTKLSLESLIYEITGVEPNALRGRPLSNFMAATRMRWASTRQTTREEDTAYCLLGIFNVNMPLLYGEGPRAFHRLQEEIIRNEGDYSILAWPGTGSDNGPTMASVQPALAGSPRLFAGSLCLPSDTSLQSHPDLQRTLSLDPWSCLRDHKLKRQKYYPPVIVSRGLLLTLPAKLIGVTQGYKKFLVSTECAIYHDSRVMVLCIELQGYEHNYTADFLVFQRCAQGSSACLHAIDEENLQDMELMIMYLPWGGDREALLRHSPHSAINFLHLTVPSAQESDSRITVIGTVPNLAFHAIRGSTNVYRLTHPAGLVNISVSSPLPGNAATLRQCFSVFYRASASQREPTFCDVLPFVRINPSDIWPLPLYNNSEALQSSSIPAPIADLLARVGSSLETRTDRAARWFPSGTSGYLYSRKY